MMSQDDKLREARSEIGQLRADLERVTAERDSLSAEGKAWADRYAKRGWELAETKETLDIIKNGLKQVNSNADLGAFFHHVRSILSED